MATIASRKPVLSSVLMQDSFNVVEGVNYQVSTIEQAADTTVAIGTVVVWSVADSAFRVLLDADVAALPVTSGLANGAPIAVVVGFDALGDAYEKEFLAGVADKVTVAFRAMVSVKDSGLKLDAGVTVPNKALVIQQLEKQEVFVKKASVAVSSDFYNESI